jgi:hypothetical protein
LPVINDLHIFLCPSQTFPCRGSMRTMCEYHGAQPASNRKLMSKFIAVFRLRLEHQLGTCGFHAGVDHTGVHPGLPPLRWGFCRMIVTETLEATSCYQLNVFIPYCSLKEGKYGRARRWSGAKAFSGILCPFLPLSHPHRDGKCKDGPIFLGLYLGCALASL